MLEKTISTEIPIEELVPTEGLVFSSNAMVKLIADIHLNGLENPVEFVVHNGTKYLVRGHHRRFACQLLGRRTLPAIERTLPFAGYVGAADLECRDRVSYHREKVSLIRRRLRAMGIETEA